MRRFGRKYFVLVHFRLGVVGNFGFGDASVNREIVEGLCVVEFVGTVVVGVVVGDDGSDVMVGDATGVVVFCFVGGGVSSLMDHCREGLLQEVAVVLFTLGQGLSGFARARWDVWSSTCSEDVVIAITGKWDVWSSTCSEDVVILIAGREVAITGIFSSLVECDCESYV